MTTLDQIEELALALPEADRAKLATHLLESLPPMLQDEDEGVAEAIRRGAEISSDPSQEISLEDLDTHVRQRRSR